MEVEKWESWPDSLPPPASYKNFDLPAIIFVDKKDKIWWIIAGFDRAEVSLKRSNSYSHFSMEETHNFILMLNEIYTRAEPILG
jgi:hypothetical protein